VRRQVPVGATAVTTVVACLGLLLGLDATAVGSLIAFGTAAIYLSFLLIAVAALVARLQGRWAPGGGAIRTVVNALAVLWLAFETINITWPQTSLAPPFYQVWAAPLVLAAIGATGLLYVLIAQPQRRLGDQMAKRPPSRGR
jgi:amino acid transporter